MKKIFVFILFFTLFGSLADAQGVSDAVNFGTVDYIGSARSLGMGNAVTAIGGDLGSITINPAGSAVCAYSQFTLSPGLSFSTAGSSYSDDGGYVYGDGVSNSRLRAKLPNCGFSLWYDTSLMSDKVKSVSFSFLANSIRDYNSLIDVTGITDRTSKFAEMAAASTGIYSSDFDSYSAYDNSSLYDYWDAVMAYKAGQISSFGENNQYVGCTEVLESNSATGKISNYIPAQLSQRVTSKRSGFQTDVLLNMGVNVENKLYLGFTMGMPVGYYSNIETVTESDNSGAYESYPLAFTDEKGNTYTNCFKSAAYRYSYYSTLSGLYAKIGAIYVSDFGLRLGAAIKTRTWYQVEESWSHSGKVSYTSGDRYSGKSSEGNWSYTYYSPWEANFGVAYVLGHFGLLSLDYEIANYASMAYGDYDTGLTDGWYDVNEEIASVCRVAASLRAGLEVNVTPAVSMRAGYNRLQGALKDGYDTHIFTLGCGYKTDGPTFVDFAVKYSRLPVDIYTPYGDYHSYEYDGGDYIETADFYAPRVRSVPSLINAVLTLGWRF